MLPLMLMLVADPLTQSMTPPPPAPPEAPAVRLIDADATMRSVDQAIAAQARCRNGDFQQASDRAVIQRGARLASSDLMFRQGDPVQMTLLLERRIGQCSVPISYDLTAPGGRLPSFPAGDNR